MAVIYKTLYREIKSMCKSKYILVTTFQDYVTLWGTELSLSTTFTHYTCSIVFFCTEPLALQDIYTANMHKYGFTVFLTQ